MPIFQILLNLEEWLAHPIHLNMARLSRDFAAFWMTSLPSWVH